MQVLSINQYRKAEDPRCWSLPKSRLGPPRRKKTLMEMQGMRCLQSMWRKTLEWAALKIYNKAFVVHWDDDIYWHRYLSTTKTNSSHLRNFLCKAQNTSKPHRIDIMERVPESWRTVQYGKTPSFSVVTCSRLPQRRLREIVKAVHIPFIETLPHYKQGWTLFFT